MPEVFGSSKPYVQFERRAVEDRAASELAGHYVARDVDFALVTPAGSKDIIEREVGPWLEQWRERARRNREDRESIEFSDYFERIYKHWCETQEVPLEGTPIKTWPVLSPAERERILAANVRTVEDLATANDQARNRIGMGGQSLIDKAKAWLDSANSHGRVANEMAGLKQENETLKGLVESQQRAIDEMRAALEELKPRRGRPRKELEDKLEDEAA